MPSWVSCWACSHLPCACCVTGRERISEVRIYRAEARCWVEMVRGTVLMVGVVWVGLLATAAESKNQMESCAAFELVLFCRLVVTPRALVSLPVSWF